MGWLTAWFGPLLSAVMIVAPLVFVAFVPAYGERDAAVRRASRRLFVWLVVSTALSLGLLGLLAGLRLRAADFLWPLFFPLWFGLAMPCLGALRPDWNSAQGTGTVRVAMVSGDRARTSPVPGAFWVVCWVVAGLMIVSIAVRPLVLDVERWVMWGVPLGVGCVVLPMGVAIGMISVRGVLREPEPMVAGDSGVSAGGLAEAYAGLRRWKAWSMASMSLLLVVVLGGVMVAMAWVPAERVWVLGFVGAGLGIGVGIWGSVVGVQGTVKRAAVRRVLLELEGASVEGGGP